MILLTALSLCPRGSKAETPTLDAWAAEANLTLGPLPALVTLAGNLKKIKKTIEHDLGVGPLKTVDLSPHLILKEFFSDYIRCKVAYQVEEGEWVNAYLLLPLGYAGPHPPVVAMHQTVAEGKREPVGMEGNPDMFYGVELVKHGYVVLAPDSLTAGERVGPGQSPYDTSIFDAKHSHGSAMGKMLWDHRKAIDYLLTLDSVDKNKIGAIGHSLGGYNALFLAAFDQRVNVTIVSCPYTRIETDPGKERWSRAGGFVHFPRLRPYVEKGSTQKLPWDFQQVLALIAPRPLFQSFGLKDEIFPNTISAAQIHQAIAPLYQGHHFETLLKTVFVDGGHRFPPDVRQSAYGFMDSYFRSQDGFKASLCFFDEGGLQSALADGRASLSPGAFFARGEMQFNGAGTVWVKGNPALSPKGSLFLEFDVYFNSIRSDYLIDHFSSETKSGYLVRTIDKSNEIQFYLGTGKTVEYVSAKAPIGRRTHVLALYDGRRMGIYLDGVLADWKSLNGPLSYTGTEDLLLGSRQAKDLFFLGTLSQLLIGSDRPFPLSITTKYLPGIVPGGSTRYFMDVQGGRPPYQWTAEGLPGGLSLGVRSGLLAGIVEQSRQTLFPVIVSVTDSSHPPQKQTRVFDLPVQEFDHFRYHFIAGDGVYRFATATGRVGPQIKIYGEEVFIVYQGIDLSPCVSKWDPILLRWDVPVRAGESLLNNDPHGHPALMVEEKGFVHVFYGANFTPLRHARSTKPRIIARWKNFSERGGAVIYPRVIPLSENERVLFCATNEKNYHMQIINGGKKSSGVGHLLIKGGEGHFVYPDAGVLYDDVFNTLHVSWSIYDYASGMHNGVYYARSKDGGQRWTSKVGVPCNLPIPHESVEAIYKVAEEVTYGDAIAVDSMGNPAVLFSTKKGDSRSADVKVAYGSGGVWRLFSIANTSSVNLGGAIFYNAGERLFHVFSISPTGSIDENTLVVSIGEVLKLNTIQPFPGRAAACFNPQVASRPDGSFFLLFQSAIDVERSYVFCYQR